MCLISLCIHKQGLSKISVLFSLMAHKVLLVFLIISGIHKIVTKTSTIVNLGGSFVPSSSS